MIDAQDIIKNLENKLRTFQEGTEADNIGTVLKNQDGVIACSGLSKAGMGEIVAFVKGGRGVVFSLDEDNLSIILLDENMDINEGDIVKRTDKILSVVASEQLLGRVINPLGKPLDGKPGITKGTDMPLEKIAAGVVQREPVDTPLKMGIKSIDAMIPVGRGQRELIIGDRGLGKTAIAIDAIINQKKFQSNSVGAKNLLPSDNKQQLKPVICIYVSIGQKASSIAHTVNKLEQAGAMEYTIVVAASASSPAALQYLAPYGGTAIAEYFAEKGMDVLIVYDDLTKHAWAYRQISLVLRRPSGREAYPGDVFYLHSRLLERAVKLNKKNGGGSITALPVIETQAGDISAYIPTNVISITDGQIFLEGNLFNIGIRPAINAGNSVSRVGSAAQTSAMKSVAGKMRLDLAQFRELAAFAQFGSELDPDTQKQLDRGQRLTEILKQPQYQPYSEAEEILAIWIVTSGNLDDIPTEAVSRFEMEFLEYVRLREPKILMELSDGQKIDDKKAALLEKTVKNFKKGFSA
jgi:F-type H+-transporting ATPase subunit alpha